MLWGTMHASGRPAPNWSAPACWQELPVSQVEALSAALEEERRLGRAKDARHKLTVERLRRHNLQLQVCTTCLPK